MDANTILNIIQLIIALVLGAVSLYLKQKNTIMNLAKDKISEAEEMYKDTTDAGGEKFEWVVTTIYELMPAAFRMVFTRETIMVLVQRMFDSMEKYAVSQMDKIAGKIEDKLEK